MNRKILVVLMVALIVMGAYAVVFANNNYKDDNSGGYEETEELLQFLEICKVPRSCGNNEKIGQYLMDFAEEHGLDAEMDAVGNVRIDHPGSKGGNIILQSHMDMVAVVMPGYTHDFYNDPITTYIEDGKIGAIGTTLGADDGSGMAIALCALKSDRFNDVAFRCIFTVDEDLDMKGAKNISADWFKGYKYMVNIDDEFDDQVLVAAAGADVHTMKYELKREKNTDNCYMMKISGLRGGHSALYIGKGRANAILLACEFVNSVESARIVAFSGGTAKNAIPAESEIIFSVPDGVNIQDKFEEFKADAFDTYSWIETDMCIELHDMGVYDECWTKKCTDDIVDTLLSLPNGLIVEDPEYGNITSSNIGLIQVLDNSYFYAEAMCRSIFVEDLDGLANAIKERAEAVGATFERMSFGGPWLESDFNEKLVKMALDAFQKEGKIVKKSVVHGSLECGYFKALVPDIQMISVGPAITDAHSIDEQMDLKSFTMIKNVVYNIIEMTAESL